MQHFLMSCFLPRYLSKHNFLLDCERCDKKRPTATMKTFLALSLKLKEVLKGKGKKKVKGASIAPSSDSTSSPIRRTRREVEENKLREEAWLQK